MGIQACTPEQDYPDQTRIYAIYSLNYNSSEDKTSASASFYMDEASTSNQQKLELTYPATVNYNGEDLVFNLNNRNYQKEFIGLIESNFTYSNYHGSKYANSISMIEPITMEITSDSAAIQFDYYFDVVGDALESNEVIHIYVESLESGIALSYTFTSLAGLSVQVSSEQLETFGLGFILIRSTRRLNVSDNVQAPPVGGEIYTEYSVQDTVYIY